MVETTTTANGGISDTYARVPCTQVLVNRDGRQRRRVVVDDGFKASVLRNGVLNPIILQRDLTLVTGERRLTASLQLGLPDIPVRFVDEVPSLELEIIELEENLKRSDLDWKDETKAVFRIHELYAATNLDWSQKDTAQALSIDQGNVSRILRVARELDTNPKLASATGVSAAYNIVSRADGRKIADAMSDILEGGKALLNKAMGRSPAFGGGGLGSGATQQETSYARRADIGPGDNSRPSGPAGSDVRAPLAAPAAPPESILLADFTKWAPAYAGPRFNFLHCDFPYGIKAFAGPQSGRDKWTTYNDDPDVYWALIKALCKNLDRLLAPSAHLMFWFSMEHYSETLAAFGSLAPELEFQPHPLLWHKTDNVGVLPDPERGPRRVYETCFIASRGDRKIVRAVSNTKGAPTDKEHHPSTKPVPVLRYFFEMFIDANTRMLDPTCGSGSSIRAAESLGAAHVLGLEISEEHATSARSALRQARAKAALTK